MAAPEEEQAEDHAWRKALLESVLPSALAPRDTTLYWAAEVTGSKGDRKAILQARVRAMDLRLMRVLVAIVDSEREGGRERNEIYMISKVDGDEGGGFQWVFIGEIYAWWLHCMWKLIMEENLFVFAQLMMCFVNYQIFGKV